MAQKKQWHLNINEKKVLLVLFAQSDFILLTVDLMEWILHLYGVQCY